MNRNAVRLLVVDDDEIHLFMVRRALKSMAAAGSIEIVVTEAKSGEQAIDLLREKAFDCVLCDYRMGAVNGIDVLQFAASNHSTAIRILLTGFATLDLEREAKARAQVHDVLEKPMTASELETLIQERVVDRHFLKKIP